MDYSRLYAYSEELETIEHTLIQLYLPPKPNNEVAGELFFKRS